MWVGNYGGDMLDVRRLRNNLDEVRAQLGRRGDESLISQIDQLAGSGELLLDGRVDQYPYAVRRAASTPVNLESGAGLID